MIGRPGRATGLLQVLLAILALSSAPILVKIGLAADVDPATLLAARLVLAAAALWLLLLAFRPGARAINRKGLGSCLLVAMANSCSLLTFYHGLARVQASVAHIIFVLYPVAAVFLLALRGERTSLRTLLRLGLGIVGVYLLVGLAGNVDLVGAALVLVAAVAYALHLTLIQWRLGDYPSETVALYVITFMAAFVTLVRVLDPAPWERLPPVGWGVVLATALVSTVLARLLLFAGIKRIGSGEAALLGPAETLLTVLWASIFLGERLTSPQWVGGSLIVFSVIFAAAPAAAIRGLLRRSPAAGR